MTAEPLSPLRTLDANRARAAQHLLDCHLCPHDCGTRRATATGVCRVGQSAYIASEMLHMGEEAFLRPTHAIFFSGCTATCAFCTAARFAFRPTYGVTVPAAALAQRILQRQAEGARSVAFIGGDPVPHIPYLLDVRAALADALKLPLVLNSNYYVAPGALELLDGVIDIHLPDLKFGPASVHGEDGGRDCGRQIGGMPHYWPVVTGAIARLVAEGKRVVVRHLLMPGHLACCTTPALEWLATQRGVEVSLLTQYLAPGHVRGELALSLASTDIAAAVALARRLNLTLVA